MIIEGHDVETASQMVDAIQSGGGGVPGLNGCSATKGKCSASLKVSDNT